MGDKDFAENSSFDIHAPDVTSIHNEMTTSIDQDSVKYNLEITEKKETEDEDKINIASIESQNQDAKLHNELDDSKADIEDGACNILALSDHSESGGYVTSNQTCNPPAADPISFPDTSSSHNVNSCPHNLRPSYDGSIERNIHRRSDNAIQEYDVTSDIGDECSESEENSNEHHPFISNIYLCPSCGWAPEMEKCPAHRSVQAGFTNGMYQFQGVMPSQIHGFTNYNYGNYAAGQRPGYPCGVQVMPTTMDVRFNPATNQAVATSASTTHNQIMEEYARTIQSLRRKTFCLSIFVIFLVFAVITLAILIS